MPQLKITGFDGLVPRMSATMLADNQAQEALNVKLYSQELRYWRGPTFEFTPAINDVRTIYKLYSGDNHVWLTWATDVDVAPGPTTDLTEARIYFTGDGVPKKTNYALASGGAAPAPSSWLKLGVPAPASAPTTTRVGTGTTGAETRTYVYTYVSTFGSVKEESAPSPASTLLTVYSGDSVTVGGFAAAPTAGYNITHRRIYRSVTGATTASFEFVAEIPVSTSTYSDNLTVAQLGEALPTDGWLPPPDDLQGLISLPNGTLAGFSGNTVYFSEPFFPHAWPLAYGVSVPDRIVGIGVFGTSVVACTERSPYIISGAFPGSLTVERVPIVEPCVSKTSVISDNYGVTYASPNGLVTIGTSTRGNVTGDLFRRQEWEALAPSEIRGGVYDDKYIAVYPSQPGGVKTMVLSRTDKPSLSYTSWSATAVHVDNRNAGFYYVDTGDNKIYLADSDEVNPYNYQWKSKRFVLPQATSFSAIKCDAAFDEVTADANYDAYIAQIQAHNAAAFSQPLLGGLNDTPLNTYAVDGSTLWDIPTVSNERTVQCAIYGDGKLVSTTTFYNFDPVRLPPFKSRSVEIMLYGNVSVRSIAIATTVPELHE